MLSDSRRIHSLNARLNDVVMQKEFKIFVLHFISQHPVDYLRSCADRSFQYWTIPNKYYKAFNIEFLFIRVIPVLILNILLIWGIIIL